MICKSSPAFVSPFPSSYIASNPSSSYSEIFIPYSPFASSSSFSSGVLSASTITDISLKPKEFISQISSFAAIDPPNSIQCIHSLFVSNRELDAQIALIPSKAPVIDDPKRSSPWILIDPAIKIIPWTMPSAQNSPDDDPSNKIRLSLLATVPATPTTSTRFLKLDMQVFSAIWIT